MQVMQSWICIARLKAQQTCQGPVILRIFRRPVKEVCVTIHGQSFKSISNQLKFKNKRWSCSNHNLRRLGCGVPPTPMSARSPQAHIATLHLVVETWSVQRGRLFSIQYTHVYTLVQFAKWESNTIKHPLIPNTYTYIILYYPLSFTTFPIYIYISLSICSCSNWCKNCKCSKNVKENLSTCDCPSQWKATEVQAKEGMRTDQPR